MCLHWFDVNIFFFKDTATTEIYSLSLHDALPISALITVAAAFACACMSNRIARFASSRAALSTTALSNRPSPIRSEEHTSELQSPCNIVCRLLLEKKNNVPRRRACQRLSELLSVP